MHAAGGSKVAELAGKHADAILLATENMTYTERILELLKRELEKWAETHLHLRKWYRSVYPTMRLRCGVEGM